MSKFNVRRVLGRFVNKATSTALEIFQETSNGRLYYKDTNGRKVELGSNTEALTSLTNTVNSLPTPEVSLYHEQIITSANLKAFPAAQSSVKLPAGYYAVIEEFTVEILWATPTYGIGTYTDLRFQVGGNGNYYTLPATLLSTVSGDAMTTPIPTTAGSYPVSQLNGNAALWSFQMIGDAAPLTNGNSDLIVKCRYKVYPVGVTV